MGFPDYDAWENGLEKFGGNRKFSGGKRPWQRTARMADAEEENETEDESRPSGRDKSTPPATPRRAVVDYGEHYGDFSDDEPAGM